MAAFAEPLILIAASGLAREVLAVVRGHGLYDVIGFLDDAPSLAGAKIDGVPVLGALDTIAAYPSARMIVCAGHGAVRDRIVTRLANLGISSSRFAAVVHPSVEVPQGCELGAGSIILAGVVLTTAVSIGEHVVIMPNVTLTHDCALHDYATVCAGTALGGSVVIARAAYLGMNSSVREGLTVGPRATLGMGSVLLTNAPAGETWVGVPARALSSHSSSITTTVETATTSPSGES